MSHKSPSASFAKWVTSVCICLVLCNSATGDELFKNWPLSAEVSVTLGKHEVVIPSGQHGLLYFPDMPLSFVSKKPLAFLVVAGGPGETYLMSGPTISASVPLRKVLTVGPPGSVDNNYAGVSSLFADRPKRRLMGFYHAEDKEGMGTLGNGVTGAYWRICAAESPLENVAFIKLGPIITSDQPKKSRAWESEGGPAEAWMIQGTGDPCVCPSGDGKYLICLYHEAGNRLKNGRGVQLCAARAPIASAGAPGSWSKFYNGSFSEPGIGGHDSPILSPGPNSADTISPQIQFVPQWQRYVMVFGVAYGPDFDTKPPKATKTGLFISTSKDTISWSRPVKLWTTFSVFTNGQEAAMHPCLIIKRATSTQIAGQLTYAYTPHWPNPPHHLGSKPIQVFLDSQASDAEEVRHGMRKPSSLSNSIVVNGKDLRGVLQGTRWKNSNNASFEWTADGRLLHQGIEREWQVLDEQRAQVVFGPGHVDTLIFNDDFSSFRQQVKGGPQEFQGRRQ